jgi:hypothetical protein
MLNKVRPKRSFHRAEHDIELNVESHAHHFKSSFLQVQVCMLFRSPSGHHLYHLIGVNAHFLAWLYPFGVSDGSGNQD